MKIKCDNEFKYFEGFQKKVARVFEIRFDNCIIKCSADHKFKSGNDFKTADTLLLGDTVDNTQFGKSIVMWIEDLGRQTVITPVSVDGEIYETPNGLINHNYRFFSDTSRPKCTW